MTCNHVIRARHPPDQCDIQSRILPSARFHTLSTQATATGLTLVGDLTKKAYTLPPLSVTVAKYWIPCSAESVRKSTYERSCQQQCIKSRTSIVHLAILKVCVMFPSLVTDCHMIQGC